MGPSNEWEMKKMKGFVHDNAPVHRCCAVTAGFVIWSVLLLSLGVFCGCGRKPAGEREAHLSVAELQQRLQEKDAEVRLGAVQGLRRHGAEAAAAVPDLAKSLADEDVRVGQAAALALGDIGPPAASAVPALTDVVAKGTNDALRRQAAAALGKIGPDAKSALPVLRSAAQNGSQIVRTAAREAIQQIQRAPVKK
jgi:HEAT repeat protein